MTPVPDLGACFRSRLPACWPLSPQTAPPHALTLPLKCASGDCSLLHGAAADGGDAQRGSSRLKPGDSVGWHTTGQNEESLGSCTGRVSALIEGEPGRSFTAPRVCLRPSGTATTSRIRAARCWKYVYVGGSGKGARSGGPNQAQRARQHFRLEGNTSPPARRRVPAGRPVRSRAHTRRAPVMHFRVRVDSAE